MPEPFDPFDRGDYVFLAEGFARDVAEGRLDDAASWVEAACEVRAGRYVFLDIAGGCQALTREGRQCRNPDTSGRGACWVHRVFLPAKDGSDA